MMKMPPSRNRLFSKWLSFCSTRSSSQLSSSIAKAINAPATQNGSHTDDRWHTVVPQCAFHERLTAIAISQCLRFVRCTYGVRRPTWPSSGSISSSSRQASLSRARNTRRQKEDDERIDVSVTFELEQPFKPTSIVKCSSESDWRDQLVLGRA